MTAHWRDVVWWLLHGAAWLALLLLFAILTGCATARPCACSCACDEAGLHVVERLQGENQRLRAQLDFWRDRAVTP